MRPRAPREEAVRRTFFHSEPVGTGAVADANDILQTPRTGAAAVRRTSFTVSLWALGPSLMHFAYSRHQGQGRRQSAGHLSRRASGHWGRC